MDFEEYSDEELLEAGREAVKREQWPRATCCSGATSPGSPPGARRCRLRGSRATRSASGTTGSCAGGSSSASGPSTPIRATRTSTGASRSSTCSRGSRKDAIESVERGLRAVPDNFLLLRLRKRLGVRQPPPIPFLDRHAPAQRPPRPPHAPDEGASRRRVIPLPSQRIAPVRIAASARLKTPVRSGPAESTT